jgi:hypothetical protein
VSAKIASIHPPTAQPSSDGFGGLDCAPASSDISYSDIPHQTLQKHSSQTPMANAPFLKRNQPTNIGPNFSFFGTPNPPLHHKSSQIAALKDLLMAKGPAGNLDSVGKENSRT